MWIERQFGCLHKAVIEHYVVWFHMGAAQPPVMFKNPHPPFLISFIMNVQSRYIIAIQV
jgi:hypothetical protein